MDEGGKKELPALKTKTQRLLLSLHKTIHVYKELSNPKIHNWISLKISILSALMCFWLEEKPFLSTELVLWIFKDGTHEGEKVKCLPKIHLKVKYGLS